MGLLFHKPQAQATKTDTINSIRVSQSVLGQTLPVIMGLQRATMSLLWYGDFTAIPVSSKTSGKGLGGGSSSDPVTTFDYTAAIIAALAQGPVNGIVNIWDTKGRFGQATVTEPYTVPPGGGSYQVGNHGNFGNDRGVGRVQAYSQVVNDYGSPGPTTLSGSHNVPMASVGPGSTRIQTTGGTTAFKYYFAGVTTNPGDRVHCEITVKNNSAVVVTVSSNSGGAQAGQAIQPGATAAVIQDYILPAGVPRQLQLIFGVPTPGDILDVIASAPVVFYNGINQNAPTNFSGGGWQASAGSVPTLTQGQFTAGQYTLNTATGTYTFHAGDAGQQLQITYTYNLRTLTTTEIVTIPGSPFQVAVQNNANFVSNLSVAFTPVGGGLVQVTSAPATGQYSVNTAGLYTFAAADSGKVVLITYTVNDPNVDPNQTLLNFTLFTGGLAQPVWGYMTSRHPDQALGYSQIAYIASPAFNLGTGAALPNYTYEVLGINSYGSGISDCNPKDCILTILLDSALGISANGQFAFPAANIGDLTQASNFWIANSFFISPLVANQQEASATIRDWLEASLVAGFFSEGKLKLAPYGDVSAAGNGVIYQPATQPVEDLDDTDFILDSPGSDPIKVTRTPLSEANNRVQIQWSNRSSGYNPEITQEQDETAVNRFGVRAEQPVNWDFITTQVAASQAASLRVKRSVNIRNEYTFRVNWLHDHLEPMDLVTLTSLNDSFFNKLPVRITKIDDDPDKGLTITAEDFPWGTATAALYPKQPPLPFFPQAGLADPGPTSALIIEAPNDLVSDSGHTLYIFCSPTQNEDWGGCNIYVSFDGNEYDYFDKVQTPARLGTLAAALAAGTIDPDTNTTKVNIQDGALSPASQVAFDAFVPLAAVFNPNQLASTTPVYLGNSPGQSSTFINMDFESSSAIPPLGWVLRAGTVASYDTTTQFAGVRSLLCACSAQFAGITSSGFFPVAPGQVLSVTGMAKSDGTHTALVEFNFYTAAQVFITSSAPTVKVTSTAWNQTTSLNQVVPANAFFAKIIAMTDSTTGFPFNIEFDNFVVTQNGYNVTGLYMDGTTFANTAGLDGAGNAYSWNNIGSHITFNGTPYQIGAANAPNVIQCTGQVINLPGGIYQAIWFLVAAIGPVNGQQNVSFTVKYSDGTTQTFTQSVSFWLTPQNYPGEFPAFNALPYRAKFDGTKDATRSYIYNFSVNLTPGKTVSAITLPNNTNLMIIAISLDVSAQTNNFELLAYRDATLSGPDQYQLATFHRGLFGTQNLPHVLGENFVRMDQASVRYQYNATFVGAKIFFKFCSFNTMGGHLLDVSAVSPLSFTLQGIGPGAIDALTGAFLPGLDQVPSGTYVFARTSAHSSYRPTTNPLTGTDAGTTATINIAAFFMRAAAFPDVAINSGSITNLAYGTLYFVYYLDLYFLGGAVNYLVTTTKEIVLQNAAAFFVGSIRTPSQTAPDTVGNLDGGAGGQMGIRRKVFFNTLPLAQAFISIGSASVTNYSANTDADVTTGAFATLTANGITNPSNGGLWTGFASAPMERDVKITLKCRFSVPTNTLPSTGGVAFQVSYLVYPDNTQHFFTDPNATIHYGVTMGVTLVAQDLPLGTNVSNIQMQAVVSANGAASGQVVARVYESWIEIES